MRTSKVWSRALQPLGAVLGIVAALGGCGSIEPIAPHDEPIVDPAQLYMRLTLDHPAITMSTAAPYNTLQLMATPRDARDNPMLDLPAPTFRSLDTTRVRVSADGMLTAVATGTNVRVIAELVTAGPVRHADTALITITNLANPPVPASFSIAPVPPDSAVWPVSGVGGITWLLLAFLELAPFNILVTPQVLDAGDVAMTGLQFEYASLDPAIATIERRTGFVTTLRPGPVRMVARSTVYGMALVDTVTFTVVPPLSRDVALGPSESGAVAFSPAEVRITPGGFVMWTNNLEDSSTVTFEDPSNVISPSGAAASVCDLFVLLFEIPGDYCGAGNLLLGGMDSEDPNSFGGAAKVRQFPVPGVYPYRDTKSGAAGRVVVTTVLD